MASRQTIAAAVLLPHFDAVRDVFAAYCPEPGVALTKATKVRFVVDDDVRDSERHFAATSEDGLQQFYASDVIDQDEETLAAIIAHEFGHSLDFLYPCRWIPSSPSGPGKAIWIDDTTTKPARMWRNLWAGRGRDQVEWAADGIAHTILGRPIVYCGDCVVQCFRGGIARPAGLR
jgi:hypothetical protein